EEGHYRPDQGRAPSAARRVFGRGAPHHHRGDGCRTAEEEGNAGDAAGWRRNGLLSPFLASSLRGAIATKQSNLLRSTGLLRFARNDEAENKCEGPGAIPGLLFFVIPGSSRSCHRATRLRACRPKTERSRARARVHPASPISLWP